MAMTTVQPSHQAKVSARTSQAFERVAEPFRREIKVHCYRMLGSLHEADDAVQETYLRAWRSFSGPAAGAVRAFGSRSHSGRRWWQCGRATRETIPLRSCIAPAAAAIQMPDGPPSTEVAWLEPYPDSNLEGIADDAPNPEARYAAREAVQLAFVAAIQVLPPRQRATLLLCDVLGWAATEAATLLGGSTASINSALQRARGSLAKRYPTGQPAAAPRPDDPAQQGLLNRYLKAWEAHDLDGFVALLKEDATFTMPPWLLWFAGRQAIGSFFAMAWKTCALTAFVPPTGSRLFQGFGLPLILPTAAGAGH
jgi:RNA polymerase sigma-70 factor, ECF subfamily